MLLSGKGDGHVGGTGDDGGDRVGDRVIGGCRVVQFGGGEGRHDDAPGNERIMIQTCSRSKLCRFSAFRGRSIFPEPF